MKDRCFFLFFHIYPSLKFCFPWKPHYQLFRKKTENTNESTIMFFLNEKGRIADSYYIMSSTATTLVTSLAAPALPKLAGTFCRQDNQQCNAMIWVQLTEVVFFIVIHCNWFWKRPMNIQKAKCTELQSYKSERINLLGNGKHYGKNSDHVATTFYVVCG